MSKSRPINWPATLLGVLVQDSAVLHLRSATANALSSSDDLDSPTALCGAQGYCTIMRRIDQIDCDACLVEYAACRLRSDETT